MPLSRPRIITRQRRSRLPPAEGQAGFRESAARFGRVDGIALLTVRRRVEGDFIGYCGLIVGRAVSRAVARDKPVATSVVIS
jgi:hypothetical protein